MDASTRACRITAGPLQRVIGGSGQSGGGRAPKGPRTPARSLLMTFSSGTWHELELATRPRNEGRAPGLRPRARRFAWTCLPNARRGPRRFLLRECLRQSGHNWTPLLIRFDAGRRRVAEDVPRVDGPSIHDPLARPGSPGKTRGQTHEPRAIASEVVRPEARHPRACPRERGFLPE